MEQNKNNSINLLTILFFLLRQWKWYVLSMILFLGLAIYNFSRTPFMYQRSATIMIKTPEHTQSTMRMNRYNSFYTQINVKGEILQFESRDLMRAVVERMRTDVGYSVKRGLRPVELYTEGPIVVEFEALRPNAQFEFIVTPIDDSKVEIFYQSSGKTMKVDLNAMLESPYGIMKVLPTNNYKSEWFGTPVTVTKSSLESMVSFYLSNFKIRQIEEETAILSISVRDYSAKRSADMLEGIIYIYNERSISDKTQSAIKTEDFLNKRLVVNLADLEDVESDLESINILNDGMDIQSTAQFSLQDTRTKEQNVKIIDSQLKTLNLIQRTLTDPVTQNNLSSKASAVAEAKITEQIKS